MLKKKFQKTVPLLFILMVTTNGVSQYFYKQAPSLEPLVQNGSLPSVVERLPENPVLLKPVKQTGEYGGCLSIGVIGPNSAWVFRTISYEGLVRWDPKWNRIIPNLAQQFTSNEDGSEYTFYLRKGVKWSDGEPFTANDIEFWYKHILLNKELTEQVPNWLKNGESVVHFEKVDDFTIKFKFDKTNKLFLSNLAHPEGIRPVKFPKHYLAKYHKDLNPKEISTLIKKHDKNNWKDLFISKSGSIHSFSTFVRNTQMPSLHAWVLSQRIKKGVNIAIAIRNPYYWKIDTSYNQLPYIDSVKYVICKDVKDYYNKVVNKEINYVTKHNRQLLKNIENDTFWEKFQMVSSLSNICAVSLNLTHLDSEKRSIFQNKKFRISLSHAINRKNIIDDLFDGKSWPYQVAPQQGSPYFHEKLAKQFIEFDPQKAKRYLTEIGLDKFDDNGYRLLPNGKPLEIKLEYCDIVEIDYQWNAVLDHIASDWAKVGIKMTPHFLSRPKFYDNKRKNLHDAAIWLGEGGADVLLEPRYYLPFSNESNYAMAWNYWYTMNHNPLAEEPPHFVKKQHNIFEQIKHTNNEQEITLLVKNLLDISAEQFYVIGICTPPVNIGFNSTNLVNVPDVIPNAWTYPTPAPTNLCQYYFEQKQDLK